MIQKFSNPNKLHSTNMFEEMPYNKNSITREKDIKPTLTILTYPVLVYKILSMFGSMI